MKTQFETNALVVLLYFLNVSWNKAFFRINLILLWKNKKKDKRRHFGLELLRTVQIYSTREMFFSSAICVCKLQKGDEVSLYSLWR